MRTTSHTFRAATAAAERRYSLLLEGVRWVDARRFDRLDDLPLHRPGDRVAPAFPVPRTECPARGLGDSCTAGQPREERPVRRCAGREQPPARTPPPR